MTEGADIHPINVGMKWRNKYIAAAQVPARYRDLNTTNIAPSLQPTCETFLSMCSEGDPLTPGIMFWGKPGRGKTATAAILLRRVLEIGPHEWLGREFGGTLPARPGYFTSYAELIRLHKAAFGSDERAATAQDLLDSLYFASLTDTTANCRVLVLDDVGKEHAGSSGFTANVLHDLLRSRFDKSTITLITTNLLPNQWGPIYGDAMASFIKEAFVQVEVKGADYRD